MPRVSVIVPIYGVERYISRCVESLMRQTLADVEYIFVNDCTKDKSMSILAAILNKYPWRNYRIVDHEQNRGLPASRNTGLSIATGDYVFHCDSDDYCDPDMLSEMYNKACDAGADIVWCNYYESFADHEDIKIEPSYDSADDSVRAMLSRTMQYNVWNKLVKRALYIDNAIEFPEGYSMGEDLTMVKLFASAGQVVYLPKEFYHYVRYNIGAMTQIYNRRKMDELHHNMEDLSRFLEVRNSGKYEKEMAYMKLWAKFRYILTDGKDYSYVFWANWFPESHIYIWSLPNANFRIKLINWSAAKKQWWIVWLHYWIVIRGVYSVIHRHISSV